MNQLILTIKRKTKVTYFTMDVSVYFRHKSGLVPYLSMLSKAHNYLGKLERTSKLISDVKLFFLIKVKDSLFL